MTEKEKAKAYDEALKKASAAHKDEDRHLKATLERIFPELKEDDDEKIKKELIQWVDEFPDIIWRGHYKKDIIDWLENQGKKSADKIKPRFNVGDWVVFTTSRNIYQVEKKENYEYTLKNIHGGSFCVSFSNEELIREWTIQDAIDGDVLACNGEILLFKSYSVLQGRISLYCWYNGRTNNFHSKEVVDILLTTTNKVCPATKEQRDALMKAIKDAGYEWDIEKKELKKKVK